MEAMVTERIDGMSSTGFVAARALQRVSDEASARGGESVIDRLSWLSVVVIIFANIRRAMMTSQTLLEAVVQLSVGKALSPIVSPKMEQH